MRAQHLLTPETEGPCWECWGCAGCGSSSSPSPVGAAPGLCSAPCSERPQPAAPSSSPFLRCEASLARPGVPVCVQEPGERPARTASLRLVVLAGWPHAAGCREVFFLITFFLKESCFPVVLPCLVHAAAIRVLGAISQEVCLQHVSRWQSVDKQPWPYSPRCWGERVAKAEASTQVGL